MIYAVIDTNVLVSALLSDKEDSATFQVVKAIIKRVVTPIYSYDILDEYMTVLRRKKFNFSMARINFLLDAISAFGLLFEHVRMNFFLQDMKDLPFYIVVM